MLKVTLKLSDFECAMLGIVKERGAYSTRSAAVVAALEYFEKMQRFSAAGYTVFTAQDPRTRESKNLMVPRLIATEEEKRRCR